MTEPDPIEAGLMPAADILAFIDEAGDCKLQVLSGHLVA